MEIKGIEELQAKLAELEAGLTDEEKVIALNELQTLTASINADVREYIDKMKVIGVKQSLQEKSQNA